LDTLGTYWTIQQIFYQNCSVLPGAFSAYRWEALQDVSPEEGPLIAYFKGETPKPEGNVFSSNMYLAEDRILCFELVAKRNAKWILHYVKDAQAETDVPSTVHEFISQRRRWLNGTFFCQIYAIAHVGRFWSTEHGFIRKMALMLEYLYFSVTIAFSWFALANFYLSFYMLTKQALETSATSWGGYLFDVLRLVYAAIIIAQFICAMGNRPQGAGVIYAGSMFLFSLIMLFLIVVTLILILSSWPKSNDVSWLVQGGTARDVVLGTVSTYGVYLFSALLYGQFTHIFTCIFQYLLLLPSYINTLTIYAFCNTHDISWGTKGDNNASVGEGSASKQSEAAKEKAAGDLQMQPKPVLVTEQSESYQRALAALREPLSDDQAKVDRSTQREDYYKNVRTWLVLAWVLSNGALVAVVSSPRISDALTSSNGSNPYMAILMYAVAAFSIVRFAGCVVYLMKWAVRRY